MSILAIDSKSLVEIEWKVTVSTLRGHAHYACSQQLTSPEETPSLAAMTVWFLLGPPKLSRLPEEKARVYFLRMCSSGDGEKIQRSN